MAKKRVVTRKYKFADSYLIQLCNTIIVFIQRDILQFADYGVTAPTVTAFTGEVNDFEDLPTDIELAGKQKVRTDAKDAAGETEKTIIRSIMARVVTVFKEDSANYEAFGTKGMSRMGDAELLICGKRVAREATDNLAALAGTGLTAAIITELTDANQAFEDAIGEQKKAISNRDIATENRAEMGNALYEKLMNYCGFGQQIWAETNEAKYNDYVIYNSSGGLVNPVLMNIVAGATEMIINKLYAETDTFDITNTGTAKLKFGFCADGVTPVEGGVDFNAGETKTVQAPELGDFATNQFLNCTNNDSVDGSFKIKLP